MANKTQTIRIDSILGGQSKYVNFASEGEFLHSYNIDPDLSTGYTQSDGCLTPTGIIPVTQSTAFGGPPLWFIIPPRASAGTMPNISAYSANGSLYTSNGNLMDFGVTDYLARNISNEDGTASGNGACYYDNYIYLAKNTTIARVGPLTSSMASQTITHDYWGTTLAKTALTNTQYPLYSTRGTNIYIPNHILLPHLGRLYIGDVVGNQGTIHYIKTKKTTVEGDTDDGSTFDALTLPYGMYPTAMESFGESIAIALYEGQDGIVEDTANDFNTYSRAKLVIWDTTSETYNTIIDFPDPVIYALLMSNGVLYAFSGQIYRNGTRVTRYVGGHTFEQIAFIDHASPPLAGAVEGLMNKIMFGGATTEPNESTNRGADQGCVWAIGTKKDVVSTSLFNIMGCSVSGATTSSIVTASKIAIGTGMESVSLITGWSTGSVHGADVLSAPNRASYSLTELGGGTISIDGSYGPDSYWRSQVYRIGQPFKITKISIPFLQRFDSASGSLKVRIYRDGIDPETNMVDIITLTGDPGNKNRATIRPTNLTCEYRFILELVFLSNSSNPYPRVGLPILIDYEVIDF